MISHPLRCAYVHPPKTGGHSIDKFFSRRGAVSVKAWHATAAETLALLPPDHGYYMFGTVRNPWDRFLSEYVWQSSDCPTQIQTPWGNKNISFRDFCLSDYSWYPAGERANGHLADQAHFLFDDTDRRLVDYIIRFEQLQEGFTSVCRILSLPAFDLPRLNVTQHEPYWSYYTDELAELIGKRFARDVRLFGYEFGR